MARPKVFVFKGVPSRFHHGALAVSRTLGRLGIPVAANDEGKRAAAARSRYRSESVVWSPWPDAAADMVEKLVAWGRVQDEPALLIPVDDAATVTLDEHATDLDQFFRFPRQPEGLARKLSSKWTMAELAHEHGVATARVARLGDLTDLDSLLDDFGLPVVVKRIEGWRADSRSVPSVSVARTRERVLEVVAQQPDSFMLQEYIPGTSATSWMFNGYFDSDSRCLFGATGYKIRQYPLSGGFTTLGQLAVHDEIQTQIVRFLSAVGYRGIVDLGLRFDERDGAYKLLDVNPRVGSTFRLFVDTAGDDVVRVCYANLVDRDSDVRTAPIAERRWSAEPHDLRAGVGLVRAKKVRISELVRSTIAVDERAWWAADDPRPFISAMFAEFRMSARLALKRLRTLG
jgi:D-aspartate ligase